MNGQEPSDFALLQAWTTQGDRQAAGDLIRRHIQFVHAVARRRVAGDPHLADDVTQAVFILLLRKAHRITSEAAMASWLYTTTQYAAANALKMLRRREFHEQQFVPVASPRHDGPAVAVESAEMQLLLHDAIAHLHKTDRLCIILGYLQQKTHAQVGEALGLSQDAARKRIARAVDRLREFLGSNAAAVATLSEKRPAVPAALIESTLNVAILSQSAGATGAVTIAKAVSHMILTTKIKVAAILVIALTATSLVTGQVVKMIHTNSAAPISTVAMNDAAPATQPDNGAADPNVADLGDGVTVEFTGVAPYKSNQWHDISGNAIPAPVSARNFRGRLTPPPNYQTLVRVTCPDSADWYVAIPSSQGMVTSSGRQGESMILFTVPSADVSADIEVYVADGPWKNAFQPFIPNLSVIGFSGPVGAVTVTPLVEQNNQSLVYVTMSGLKGQTRLACIDVDGQEHVAQPRGGAGVGVPGAGVGGSFNTTGYLFDLPPQQIKQIEIQSRPYNKHVIAKDICLDPANPTTPQILINP